MIPVIHEHYLVRFVLGESGLRRTKPFVLIDAI